MSLLNLSLFCINILKSIFKKIIDYYQNEKKIVILYESDHFVIIDKCYDLKINSNNASEQTVQTHLRNKRPKLVSNKLFHQFYFVQRLDFSTSGVMCIPVHKKACQVVAKAIEKRKCQKYYIALVRGQMSVNFLRIALPIGRCEGNYEIEKMCVNETGRAAETLITVLESGEFMNYPATKVLIRVITGRRHQIRVHLSHIGHTIVGDFTYSNKRDICPQRMFLHSLRLVIFNEIENIEIETMDPFSSSKIPEWKPHVFVSSIENAFPKLTAGFENFVTLGSSGFRQ